MKATDKQESQKSEKPPAQEQPAVRGGCLCGKISYSGVEPIAFAVACHCRSCQRQSGSALSTIAAVPAGSLSIEGDPALFVTTGDSGSLVQRYFCRDCGSPLYSLVEAQPAFLWLKTGSLDSAYPPPSAHIWWSHAQPWMDGDFASLPKAMANPPAS